MIKLNFVEFQADFKTDSVVLLISVVELCYGLCVVFICCELGERASNTFTEINDEIDQLSWYLFPIKIKRQLPFILIYTQTSVDLTFFGSMSCSRENFKKVCSNLLLTSI